MKTAIELPDDLMRRIKLRAVQHNRKLKDEIAQLLEAGIASTPMLDRPRELPKPVRLRGHRSLTLSNIEAAIAVGRSHA